MELKDYTLSWRYDEDEGKHKVIILHDGQKVGGCHVEHYEGALKGIRYKMRGAGYRRRAVMEQCKEFHSSASRVYY